MSVKFTIEVDDKDVAKIKKLPSVLEKVAAAEQKLGFQAKVAATKLEFLASKERAVAKAAAEAARKIEEQKNKTKELKNAIGNLIAGAALAGVTLKKAFDFAQAGAEIQLVEQRFDRLAVSVGTTADVLENQLGVATKGMLSDFESVKLASELMSLGLANSGAETTRLTGIVADLGLDMNQLVLTMTNMTTMRFDALGIRVEGFKEKVKDLEEQGLSAADAFKEAFLRQAEEQIALVGSAADTAAGQFKVFENNVKNALDALKKGVATSTTPAITALNQLVFMSKLLDAAIEQGALSQDKAGSFYRDAAGNAISYSEAVQIAAETQAELNAELEAAAFAQANLEGNIANGIEALQIMNEEMNLHREVLDTVGNASRFFADGVGLIKNEVEGASVAFSDFNLNLGSMIEKTQNFIEFEERGGDAIQAFIERLQEQAEANANAGDSQERVNQQLSLAEELARGVESGYGAAAETAARLNAQTDELAASLLDDAKNMADLIKMLDALEGKQIFVGINIDAKLGGSGAPFLAGGGGLSFKQTAEVSRSATATGTSSDSGLINVGGAHGIEGIVPRGFPNDTFKIGATSGEEFSIKTPAQQQQGGGDNSDIVNAIEAQGQLILDGIAQLAD